MNLLILGTGDGLASTMARAASERGAKVALAATTASAHNGCVSFPGSQENEAAVDTLIENVVAQFPTLDSAIIVLPAVDLGPLHEVLLDRWHELVTDPLRRAFLLARRVVEEFLASGRGGRLILVVSSNESDANLIVQEAATSFARSVAREYGRRALTCNVVLSALGVDSPASGSEPIADCALFLASGRASFVNGEAFVVAAKR
jgi:NAD(P)-dependent dehydrogenase (short-subunit alcohol dehydrogenase family)